jgi:hypothetical protein
MDEKVAKKSSMKKLYELGHENEEKFEEKDLKQYKR